MHPHFKLKVLDKTRAYLNWTVGSLSSDDLSEILGDDRSIQSAVRALKRLESALEKTRVVIEKQDVTTHWWIQDFGDSRPFILSAKDMDSYLSDGYGGWRLGADVHPATAKEIADPDNLVTTYSELESAFLTSHLGDRKEKWERFWQSRRWREFDDAKKNLREKGYSASEDYLNREVLGPTSYRVRYTITTNMLGPTYPSSTVIGEGLSMEDVVRREKELASIREESFSHQEKLYREKRKAERANAVQPIEVSAGSRKRRVT
jgi:hypothetical protein